MFIIYKIFLYIYGELINMITSILPSIFVPLIGLVFPAIAMASLFLYIETDQIS
jgi:photosystem I subunit 8